MKDINKIKIIHEIRNGFSVDDKMLNKFIEQIDNLDYKENIERFFRGYAVEDNFHILYAAMPWVKLIHELGQTQLPNLSKEVYQVPDFTIFYETNKKESKPILVEIKSVKGGGQSLEIMSKQLNACIEYSEIAGIPFLYAIYWDKYRTWTFNSIENFEVKLKKHKINFFDAFKNDLSVIVGDITFVINHPIYRRTTCDSSITDTISPRHQKFGVIISDSVSVDNINFTEIQGFESAIIDCIIKMKIIDTKIEGNKTTIIEISNHNYFSKLSTLTLQHLAIFGAELNEQHAVTSRKMIVEFFKKLNITPSFSIPHAKTTTSDILYKQAFGESWVHSNYSAT